MSPGTRETGRRLQCAGKPGEIGFGSPVTESPCAQAPHLVGRAFAAFRFPSAAATRSVRRGSTATSPVARKIAEAFPASGAASRAGAASASSSSRLAAALSNRRSSMWSARPGGSSASEVKIPASRPAGTVSSPTNAQPTISVSGGPRRTPRPRPRVAWGASAVGAVVIRVSVACSSRSGCYHAKVAVLSRSTAKRRFRR